MAIPDYQTRMLPLLQFAGDRQEHSLREAIDALADVFNLNRHVQKLEPALLNLSVCTLADLEAAGMHV